MELNKKPWPLATIFGIRVRIDTNPDYQRPPVWSLSQKQLLIDTILRGYDIPKMYWRKIGKNPDKYEVVDGQQRLRAIWEYMSGEFSLGKSAEPIEPVLRMTVGESPKPSGSFDVPCTSAHGRRYKPMRFEEI